MALTKLLFKIFFPQHSETCWQALNSDPSSVLRWPPCCIWTCAHLLLQLQSAFCLCWILCVMNLSLSVSLCFSLFLCLTHSLSLSLTLSLSPPSPPPLFLSLSPGETKCLVHIDPAGGAQGARRSRGWGGPESLSAGPRRAPEETRTGNPSNFWGRRAAAGCWRRHGPTSVCAPGAALAHLCSDRDRWGHPPDPPPDPPGPTLCFRSL